MKLVKKEHIFTDPPFAECHASTVLITENETKLCAWFAGSKEGKDDVRIYLCRLENGIWSPPEAITPDDGIPHWNPVLFEMERGTVTLFYKVGRTIADWRTFCTFSRDSGRTWSEPCELAEGDVSGGRGPVKNKCLLLSDGSVLAPASVERGAWRCFIDRFDGEKWESVPIPVPQNRSPELHLIQPTLWESDGGHVHALMRSRNGFVYRSDSCDMGKSWSEAYPTSVPNNNSGIDCCSLSDGTVALVCNPIPPIGKRTPLTLLVSRDGGASFERVLDLECEEGEFSYPAIVAAHDRLLVSYTYKRKSIAYAEIAL